MKERTDGSAWREAVSTYRPREILHPEGQPLPAQVLEALGPDERPVATPREAWRFEPESARSSLLRHFRTLSLESFGLETKPLAVAAAGAALQYLEETQKGELDHFTTIRSLEEADTLVLDPVTQRNLELLRSQSEGGREGSLIAVLDRTATSMGARTLRSWLLRPLLRLDEIGERLDAVEELAFETILRGKAREQLKSVLDLERILSRITLETAGPRDFVGLLSSLSRVPALRALTADVRAGLLSALRAELDPLEDVRSDIETTLVSEPPATLKDGGAIREGVSAELDEIRSLRSHGRETLARIETRERQRTGIGSLKVRFNKVFGYYIEVTKSNLGAVPADYIRKQTLVGSERYVTPELKEYEEKILNAEERIQTLEREIFSALNDRVRAEAPRIRKTAQAIGASSTCSCRSPRWRRPRTTPSRGSTTASPSSSRTRATRSSRRRAPSPSWRTTSPRRGTIPRHPHRAEHGREVDLPAPDRAHRADGAHRLFRPGVRGEDSSGRSHLHPRGRFRQSVPRTLDLHGGDAGDGAHPEPRHAGEASSSSTRLAAARRPTTGSRSPGRWRSTSRPSRA